MARLLGLLLGCFGLLLLLSDIRRVLFVHIVLENERSKKKIIVYRQYTENGYLHNVMLYRVI
jgi:hypothetical protein